MTEKAIQDAKVLHVAAPTLIPLLEGLEREAYERLLNGFRNTGSKDMAIVAECAAYNRVLEEIKTRLTNLEIHYKKEHHGNA